MEIDEIISGDEISNEIISQNNDDIINDYSSTDINISDIKSISREGSSEEIIYPSSTLPLNENEKDAQESSTSKKLTLIGNKYYDEHFLSRVTIKKRFQQKELQNFQKSI